MCAGETNRLARNVAPPDRLACADCRCTLTECRQSTWSCSAASSIISPAIRAAATRPHACSRPGCPSGRSSCWPTSPTARIPASASTSTGRTRPGQCRLVVFLYGGCWTTGARRSYRFLAHVLGSRGFAVAIPDYRLFPDARFPDFLVDTASAIGWLHRNAGEHGIRGDRMALLGHSAGAYNAAMVALDPDLSRARRRRRPRCWPAWSASPAPMPSTHSIFRRPGTSSRRRATIRSGCSRCA